MLSRLESKIVLTALLLLVPITGGLVMYTVLQVQESKQFSNQTNGYIEPKWLGYEIDQAQESLVTIDCAGSLGSGFGFSLDDEDRANGFAFKAELDSEASSYIVTNAHVLKSCGVLGPKIIGEDSFSSDAKIVELDVDNDLALLQINKEIPPLFGSYTTPYVGFWVMALGSPHSFAGSVTFGAVINRDTNLIFTTASLSPGNSGGPLIDNEGLVFGVNSGSKPVGQNFNISVGVNVFCEKLIICPTERYMQED